MSVKNFLSLMDFSRGDLEQIIERASELKRLHESGIQHRPLDGKTMAMIFELKSTRTRVAFETGMHQLGGHAIFLRPDETQLGRGEPIEDTAHVLSSLVDIVMLRVRDHTDISRFAAASSVPVINGMSDRFHPCQLLADMQTFVERRGSIRDQSVAFIGDGYNMCNSYILASSQFDFDLAISTPTEFRPDEDIIGDNNRARWVATPEEAVSGANLVVTDVWSSMGRENERSERREAFRGFQVNSDLLDNADANALFMHCLPAHRGEEISDDLLDDPRSVVWEEAGNRLHSQKALLEFMLG
ncbi:MAG: ornithine carbamoyltransferase [Pseudomonadota bacterium]|nr:ornithine carbamoyltransferase [Pseudomonadota bacterium]